MSLTQDQEHAEFFEKQGEMLDRACRALASKFAELWSSVERRERAAFEAGKSCWTSGKYQDMSFEDYKSNGSKR